MRLNPNMVGDSRFSIFHYCLKFNIIYNHFNHFGLLSQIQDKLTGNDHSFLTFLCGLIFQIVTLIRKCMHAFKFNIIRTKRMNCIYSMYDCLLIIMVISFIELS